MVTLRLSEGMHALCACAPDAFPPNSVYLNDLAYVKMAIRKTELNLDFITALLWALSLLVVLGVQLRQPILKSG